jgi:hypothetical protein
MDKLELAERCEQAAGPDRELDMLIDCALKGIKIIYPTEGHPMTPGRGGRIEAAGTFELLGWIDPGEINRNFSPFGGEDRYPPVTASLDAAMTLVPEGLIWAVTNCGAEDRLIPDMSVASAVVGKADDPSKPSVAATPALALCAAALRAREGASRNG